MSTKNKTEEMNQAQAINVLIQAARISQAKGAFTLEDAELVSKAIKVFIPPAEETKSEEDPAVNEEPVDEPMITKV